MKRNYYLKYYQNEGYYIMNSKGEAITGIMSYSEAVEQMKMFYDEEPKMLKELTYQIECECYRHYTAGKTSDESLKLLVMTYGYELLDLCIEALWQIYEKGVIVK